MVSLAYLDQRRPAGSSNRRSTAGVHHPTAGRGDLPRPTARGRKAAHRPEGAALHPQRWAMGEAVRQQARSCLRGAQMIGNLHDGR